jgi:hypothetical protein
MEAQDYRQPEVAIVVQAAPEQQAPVLNATGGSRANIYQVMSLSQTADVSGPDISAAEVKTRPKVVEVIPGFLVDNDETGFRDIARSPDFERILATIARLSSIVRKPDTSVPASLRYEGA